jgi:hypothetical protein
MKILIELQGQMAREEQIQYLLNRLMEQCPKGLKPTITVLSEQKS